MSDNGQSTENTPLTGNTPPLMPMTDACNLQFDQWDASIEEWKKGNRELAKKKLEELKKCIKSWTDAKQAELELEKEKTEQSPIIKAFNTLKEAYDSIGDDITQALTAIKNCFKAIMDFIEEVKKYVADKIVDLGAAITVISTRATNTISNCAIPL